MHHLKISEQQKMNTGLAGFMANQIFQIFFDISFSFQIEVKMEG